MARAVLAQRRDAPAVHLRGGRHGRPARRQEHQFPPQAVRRRELGAGAFAHRRGGGGGGWFVLRYPRRAGRAGGRVRAAGGVAKGGGSAGREGVRDGCAR